MSISLTIKDRFELIKYTHKLPCTLALRLSVDDFLDQLELTEEERAQYGVKVDPVTYDLSVEDESYAVTYEKFPEAVVKSITSFVRDHDTEEGQKSLLMTNALTIFKKIL